MNVPQLLPASVDSFLSPLVEEVMKERVPEGFVRRQRVESMYGNELERVVRALKARPTVSAARILLHGRGQMGKTNSKVAYHQPLPQLHPTPGQSTHLLPSLLSQLDHLPVFSLAPERIFSGPASPEELISSAMRSALRAAGQGSPALLLVPNIDVLADILPPQGWRMLHSALETLVGPTAVLVLASASRHYADLARGEVGELFPPETTYEMQPPAAEQRRAYFAQVLHRAEEKPFYFDRK